jgi:hypothetical protein
VCRALGIGSALDVLTPSHLFGSEDGVGAVERRRRTALRHIEIIELILALRTTFVAGFVANVKSSSSLLAHYSSRGRTDTSVQSCQAGSTSVCGTTTPAPMRGSALSFSRNSSVMRSRALMSRFSLRMSSTISFKSVRAASWKAHGHVSVSGGVNRSGEGG